MNGDYGGLALTEDTDSSEAKVYRNLQEDMWGVSILEVVTDFAEFFDGRFSLGRLMRSVFTATAMCVNLGLQFVILYYVNKFIVGQAVHETQTNYARYHREVFARNGTFMQEIWENWDGPLLKLCNMAVSKITFTFAIVFLWTGRMLGELRTILDLHHDVHHIKDLPANKAPSDMVFEVMDDSTQKVEEYHLVFLNCKARMCIYVLVIIPKFLIAIILTWIGCRWLAATESFSDLILNALALEFVINIDEFMFSYFSPAAMRERLGALKIIHYLDPKHHPDDDYEIIRAYITSLMYMMVAAVWSWVYLQKFQQVLPSFQHDIHQHCDDWFDRRYEPLCRFGQQNCFPYGGGK